ncbi:MAG: hypothetical protein QM479_11405 [Pseudomonadota bacterium]
MDKTMATQNLNISNIIDEEIELLEYVTQILNNKYRIFLISILSACLMYGATYIMPVKYESFVRLALVEVSELGGVSPDNRRAPEALTLLEQDFLTHAVNDNQQDRVIARMRSSIFTMKFIKDNNLLPIMFHKRWDKQQQQWKDNFKPDLIMAAELFKKNICSIRRNKDNNLMMVKVKLSNPQLAADIANKFVYDFNQYRRSSDIKDADRKIKFLRSTLEQTNFLAMQKSIYRLIEAQLVIKMLASNKQQYVLEVLDPAITPVYKASPATKRMTALAFIATFMFCIVVIIGRVVFKRMKLSIKQYKRLHHVK